ncbi:MAG: sulfatase-like hydrolase/transferase [Verrucomicrobiota bacterium]
MRAFTRACSIGFFIGVSLMEAVSETPPHILLIQVDDLGYGDLGLHGNEIIQTPHLDRLGEESMRFSQFYVHPLCAPTRASLLTGRHFWRTGVHGVHGATDFLHLDEITVAEVLREAGYRTGMWGKWHSGKTDGYFPWDRGFQEAFMARLYRYEDNVGMFNGQARQTAGWTPAVLTDFAIEFLSRETSQPFFGYLSYLSPHGKWAAPEEYVAPYRRAGFTENSAKLFGMITHFDHHIGRLMGAIDELGLRDSTLVIFLSDNGPARRVPGQPIPDEEWEKRNEALQLRGHKSNLYENGIRSPLFLRWGNRLVAGEDAALLSVMDLLPTLAELGGGNVPSNLDGTSFARLLLDEEATWPERELIFSGSQPKLPEGVSKQVLPLPKGKIESDTQLLGWRTGHEKFLKQGASAEWFHLPSDLREERNLANERPDLAQARRAHLNAWFEEVLADSRSFARPILLVGHEGAGRVEIPAYCLAETKGGVRNGSHSLNRWKVAGDAAVYHLDVKTPGAYAIEIRMENPVPSGTRFQVALGEQRIFCSALADGPAGVLTGEAEIDMPRGAGELQVELLSTLPSEKSMSSLILRRL